MQLNNPHAGVLTVWSDVSCPWATLALHTLHQVAAERGVRLTIDHRVFPLELLNRQPGSRPEHDEEIATITAVRADLRWSPWEADDWTFPATTLPALAAVQAAKQQGLEAADALDTALRRAFFVDQRCIALIPVIEDIARDCAEVDADTLLEGLRSGAGQAAVFADLEVARSGQIQGSPHVWTSEGPFAANPGVEDVADFTDYDFTWVDQLL
ncbi:DsbA family oxidoreductase [Ornithinimicrobium cryptoxanthini]|uniref:DsbA family protein n=1 Tax=Ornithinimicrobium cryptoxanthini TaxID=2934161 RepID=A0ABY4YFM2_9MICO|nr:DsbA family protein [Ornithinimicrobium cryptoxanthini]USQ75562.1 DsbA family protein [Ornithinimicrobium cryptoxanthini]